MTQVATKKAWLYIVCLFLLTVLLTVGCTGANSSNRENTSSHQTNTSSKITTPNIDRKSELRDRIKQSSQAAQGCVGVTDTVLETGESVSLNGNQQFPMQSVYTFPIAMAVLVQVDQGKLELN